MLGAVVDRSTTHERRRREKLCRRWLTGAYGRRPVMMTTERRRRRALKYADWFITVENIQATETTDLEFILF